MALKYRIARGSLYGPWKYANSIEMSARGMLMNLPEILPLGSFVETLMNWPGLYFDEALVQLRLAGRVSRVDDRGTLLRFTMRRFEAPESSVRPVESGPAARVVAARV